MIVISLRCRRQDTVFDNLAGMHDAAMIARMQGRWRETARLRPSQSRARTAYRALRFCGAG